MNVSKKIPAMLFDRLQAEFPDFEAINLYGSQATGHATAESDWDVAFLSRKSLSPIDLWSPII